MAKLEWNAVGDRTYQAGVDHGVLYPMVGPAVPWDGLISIKDNPEDFDTRITYMDGQKVQTQLSLGTYAATITAMSYPLEFDEDKPFNFSFRTLLANDLKPEGYGYLIHLVFNATAEPSAMEYKSLNNLVDLTPFQWAISTSAIQTTDSRPASHLVIDSTQAYPAALAAIEDILYGTVALTPRLPTMQEILDLFETYAIFKVVDHGDGTATISGPDSAVLPIGLDEARFTWPSVVQMDEETFRLSSL